MRISDWSSDVCSSDLHRHQRVTTDVELVGDHRESVLHRERLDVDHRGGKPAQIQRSHPHVDVLGARGSQQHVVHVGVRSDEHTSELQSLMRISYAVFCLHTKNKIKHTSYNRCYTNNSNDISY